MEKGHTKQSHMTLGTFHYLSSYLNLSFTERSELY